MYRHVMAQEGGGTRRVRDEHRQWLQGLYQQANNRRDHQVKKQTSTLTHEFKMEIFWARYQKETSR